MPVPEFKSAVVGTEGETQAKNSGPGWQWEMEQVFRFPGGFGWKTLDGS